MKSFENKFNLSLAELHKILNHELSVGIKLKKLKNLKGMASEMDMSYQTLCDIMSGKNLEYIMVKDVLKITSYLSVLRENNKVEEKTPQKKHDEVEENVAKGIYPPEINKAVKEFSEKSHDEEKSEKPTTANTNNADKKIQLDRKTISAYYEKFAEEANREIVGDDTPISNLSHDQLRAIMYKKGWFSELGLDNMKSPQSIMIFLYRKMEEMIEAKFKMKFEYCPIKNERSISDDGKVVSRKTTVENPDGTEKSVNSVIVGSNIDDIKKLESVLDFNSLNLFLNQISSLLPQ